MTVVEIIEEIRRLPREEQVKVAHLARQVAENPLLSPEELGELAKRMVEAKDATEADRLQEEIVRGFYGGQSDAYDPPPQAASTVARSSLSADTSAEHFTRPNRFPRPLAG